MSPDSKAVITFTPGKSILSNTAIPCAHADPYFGTLGPGESAEAKGEILFTESSLDEAVDALRKEGAEAKAGKRPLSKAARVQDR